MMLNKLDIEGLFGLYNYSLDFTQGADQRLKIITGPNGYGKTTVLQLIYALLCKDADVFFRIPFSRVVFFFENYIIQVIQTRKVVPVDEATDLPGDEEIRISFELMNNRFDSDNQDARIEGQLDLVLNSMKCFFLTDNRILLRNKEQQEKREQNAEMDSTMKEVAVKIANIVSKGDNERGIGFFKELVSFFKFSDKEMLVDGTFGIRFKMNNENKTLIPITALSSGEKHVLLQLFELIFEGKSGDLVIIDEPELSFHPAWLNVYVSVLEKIQDFKMEEGREMQVILATHSSMLVGGRWDETLDLYTLRNNG